LAKGIESKDALVLQNVYDMLFPKTSNMPSATDFGATAYLMKNISNEYFDQEDAKLIIQGTKDFLGSFPEFLEASHQQKEQMITNAYENDYGYNWLSTLIYYGIEALLTDPIYGGNINQTGWKALQHKPGLPRPKKTYGRTA
jgi:gluconate 2-dehydrogenase gamma chain